MASSKIYNKRDIKKYEKTWLDALMTLSLETATPLLSLMGLDIESSPQLRQICQPYPGYYYDHVGGAKAIPVILDDIALQLDPKLAHQIFVWATQIGQIDQDETLREQQWVWSKLFQRLLLQDADDTRPFYREFHPANLEIFTRLITQHQSQRYLLSALFNEKNFLTIAIKEESHQLWTRVSDTYVCTDPIGRIATVTQYTTFISGADYTKHWINRI